MSMLFWICLAIALALTVLAIALYHTIKRAVISATTLEELEHAALRNRQSHRRTD
jgi:hypothetical protein